jgi:C4-dicarboxylate-specific signal transduction histidine kinase
LSTISLSAENGRLLIDKASPAAVEAARAKFDRILEQVDRARDIIVRISRYARIEDDDPEPVDLAQVVNTAMTFMRPLLVQENVSARIDLRFARPPQLLLSRVGLEQIFVNAIQNAVDAIVSRRAAGEADLAGTIDVVAALTDAGLTIRIIDNGTGLTLGHAETAFDAFVTTKPWDRGTGLGLYISRQIVTEIGGAIAIRSRPSPERGAEMTIDLPPFIIAAKRGGRGA